MFNEIGPRTLSPTASKSPGLIHILGLGGAGMCAPSVRIFWSSPALCGIKELLPPQCRATEGKQTSQAVGAVPDIFIDSVSCTLGFTS